jgi:hypothetical protein
MNSFSECPPPPQGLAYCTYETVQIQLKCPLSGVHFIMMVKSAQFGAFPFHKVVVYTPLISPLPFSPLWACPACLQRVCVPCPLSVHCEKQFTFCHYRPYRLIFFIKGNYISPLQDPGTIKSLVSCFLFA